MTEERLIELSNTLESIKFRDLTDEEITDVEELKDYLIDNSNRLVRDVRQGALQSVLRTDIQEKYNELIMAVAKKFTNETRHETALRYIKEAESFNDNTCAENESEQSA